MIYTSLGIVLGTLKYSETSVIAQIYTKAFGRQSYLINGVRSAKSKTKAALLQPLTLLELEVYHRPKKSLQRIKEMKLAYPFTSIPFNMAKSALALFLAEFLSKVIKESSELEWTHNPQFDFVFHYIQFLDQTPASVANLHLGFMIHLSHFLGFQARNNFHAQNMPFFDLKAGTFVAHKPIHTAHLSLTHSQLFSQLLATKLTDLAQVRLNKSNRQGLIQALLLYYQLHVENFTPMKSLPILQTLF